MGHRPTSRPHALLTGTQGAHGQPDPDCTPRGMVPAGGQLEVRWAEPWQARPRLGWVHLPDFHLPGLPRPELGRVFAEPPVAWSGG